MLQREVEAALQRESKQVERLQYAIQKVGSTPKRLRELFSGTRPPNLAAIY